MGVVLVFRDVSERRRIEAERQANASDRDRLLEAERVARAEAERASRVKDDFVAMVSHELRTPLNAILGWTQLMAQTPQDVGLIDRGLDVIARNTRVQAELISDLLDISRITAGKLRLDIRAVDITEVVDNAIETIRGEAESKGIDIQSQHDSVLSEVAGDPARLQVIWNLLSNAIKFSARGDQVHVTLRNQGGTVEIAIRDRGAGIRAEFLPHVFDRFHQADQSITRRFGGLGLGLAIVKKLVELQGGTVRAESAGEGHGSTFTVSLPIGVPTTRPETRISDVRTNLPPDHTSTLAGLRVLVVEDEPDTREFLIRLLEQHGAVVIPTASAAEALNQFRAAEVDILVSDIGLPQVDGYDLIRQIRQERSPDGLGIPAIALTAFARAEDRTRALRAGFQSHLAKPIETSELVAAIASFRQAIEAQRRLRA